MQLSLVIPTYNERDNLPVLAERLTAAFQRDSIDAEIIVVDDNSPDGTGALADELGKKYRNLCVVHRKGKEGLSSAVLAGFAVANAPVVGVMDADLSHSPEDVPRLFAEIDAGADFVVGSRYIKGGRIEGWTMSRRVLSWGGTVLGRAFTSVRDPMTGFLLIRNSCLEGREFNAKGFKICLELLVKAKYASVKEVPITFINRTKGKSKASFKECYLLLNNLWGYVVSSHKRAA